MPTKTKKKATKKKATAKKLAAQPTEVHRVQPPPTETALTAPTQSSLAPTGIESRSEGLALALAVAAKAEVEARYQMALAKPRNEDQARSLLLRACHRTKFADKAMYRFPVGKDKFIEGLSIRFAEEAIRLFGNIMAAARTLYEDDDCRTVGIQLIDLENNTSYSTQATIKKTIERRYLKKDQKALSERFNSFGDRLFIIEATEQDMAAKTNSAISKAMRNQGLRLIPADIKEEALEIIEKTRLMDVLQDPDAARKNIQDAFMGINVHPKMLEEHLGQSLATASPVQIDQLRKLFSAIRDGQTTWGDIAQARAEEKDKEKRKAAKTAAKTPETGSLSGLSAGDTSTHTKPGEKQEPLKPAAGRSPIDEEILKLVATQGIPADVYSRIVADCTSKGKVNSDLVLDGIQGYVEDRQRDLDVNSG